MRRELTYRRCPLCDALTEYVIGEIGVYEEVCTGCDWADDLSADISDVDIEQAKVRRMMDEIDGIDSLPPLQYAELTGDTSRLSPEEMERYWERRIERMSGYR